MKQRIALFGNNKRIVMGDDADDANVCTKKDKITGWYLKPQPINFADGTIRKAIVLTIGEEGLYAGKTKIDMKDTMTFVFLLFISTECHRIFST